MQFILENQWFMFISLEIISFLSLMSLLIIRYVFLKDNLGRIYLSVFVLFIFLEAALAVIVFVETGKIDIFQVVIFIFIIYTCIFGINNIKKLDCYIKDKIKKWRDENRDEN